jgi:hypothetical protein
MKKNNDYLLLKLGTITGWCFENSPEAFEALKEYKKLGFEFSAMAQHDTDRQKELICIMIDKVNGSVQSDWTGEDWSENRAAAKGYIMEYGKKKAD